jgi:transposase
MSNARLIISAVVVEGRSKSEVARDYDVSRYWVQQLVKRWQIEGEAAYQSRSQGLGCKSPPTRLCRYRFQTETGETVHRP